MKILEEGSQIVGHDNSEYFFKKKCKFFDISNHRELRTKYLNTNKYLKKNNKELSERILDKRFRIDYVRYGNNFLIGIKGNEEKAVEVRFKIHKFLKDKLQLNLHMEKILIISSIKTKGRFLGADIRLLKGARNDTPVSTSLDDIIKTSTHIPQGYIRAFVPIEDLIKKLEELGMCNIIDLRNKKVIPHKKAG